ncbi:class I SAM-dependent methyltransferase [Streptomyces sp. NPDC059949]|uniref:class I SAM-dependent methyltransferase n=1 Tax=Streptomyces sp. NPDC059949 TaxID=3347013 RepID=UPI003661D63B
MVEFSPSGSNRLHLGCGRTILDGWINVDSFPLPGIDMIFDLEMPDKETLPFPDESVDEFLLSHVIEHIDNSLGLMQELHRVAKPDAVAWIRTPHGASDDAHEDPTHVRCYFPNSFGYFSQPYYWRADYGYRGDWLTEVITLRVQEAKFRSTSVSDEEIHRLMARERNIVSEMVVKMRAVKPIRLPERSLQKPPTLTIERV